MHEVVQHWILCSTYGFLLNNLGAHTVSRLLCVDEAMRHHSHFQCLRRPAPHYVASTPKRSPGPPCTVRAFAHPPPAVGAGGCSEYRSPRMSSASDRAFGGAAGADAAAGTAAARAAGGRGGGAGSVARVMAPGGAVGEHSNG